MGERPVLSSAVILLIIFYILLNLRHVLVYLLLLAASAFLHYRHYKGFPTINLGHVFFIAFIIDWHDGLAGEILFIVLAGLVPEIVAGYFELKTLLAYPLMIAVISVPVHLVHTDLVLLGILSSTVYHAIIFAASGITKEPLHERLLEVVAPWFLNILYFMYLANPLYSLLDLII